GYKNVTIEKICENSGITKSTFYYHFDSKDSILDEFIVYSNAYVEENFNKLITSSNYVEQLWSFYLISSKPTYDAGAEISKQVFISNLNKDHNFFAPGDFEQWETEKLLILKAQESGQILNPASPQQIAESLIFAMEGATLVWSIKNGNFDIMEKIRQVFETILIINPDNPRD
ncbi:MAG: TetR/AcrR family transcriptional regulator, partial [Tissierellia bacterium]|nr:TetR/AcrR family transcriptional regulator [Tissierellia bacterium]